MEIEIIISLLTLIALEVVLGIDNIIFISILSSTLPGPQQARARSLGLMGAFVSRILLLLSITLNAMCFGILGEYVGRMFQQTTRRPLPIVERQINPAAAAPSAPPSGHPPTARSSRRDRRSPCRSP